MKNRLNLSMLFIALFLFTIPACKLSSDQSKSTSNDEVTEEVIEIEEIPVQEAELNEDVEIADENTLVYILPDFKFVIPFAAESGYIKELTEMVDMEYQADLFLMYESDAFGADFNIYSEESGFRVITIEQQASGDLFFNEDGSGGTWTIDGVEAVYSDWVEIEPSEDGESFHSMTFEELESSIPDFSEGSYEAAEETKAKAQIQTTYMALPASNKFRITYETDLQAGETIIAFYLLHGD